MVTVQIILMCRKQKNNHENSTHLYRIVNETWKLSTSITIKHVINKFVTREKETSQPVLHIWLPSTWPRNRIRRGKVRRKQICEFSYKLAFNRMDRGDQPLCTGCSAGAFCEVNSRGPRSIQRKSMWDLWCTKWQCFSEYLDFFLSGSF
jgi:hypothetical protein